MTKQHGGFRERAGRPKTGTTKSISLTLSDDVWGEIEEIKEDEGISQSALLRSIVENHFNPSQDDATDEEKKQRYEEFKEFVFGTDVNKLTFHLYHHGLMLLSPVEKVEPYYDADTGVKITFRGGDCHIWSTNLIHKCPRPANLIVQCEMCYSLYNEYGTHIGYVYTTK